MLTAEQKAKRAAYMCEYNRRNAEHVYAQRRHREATDPELRQRRRATSRATYERYRKDRIERVSAYQQAHKIERKAYLKDYAAKNSAKAVARMRDWKKSNPVRARALARNSAAVRRQKIRNADPKLAALCTVFIERESLKPIHACYYCRRSFRGEFHIDHVLAIALGGKHEPANLAVACPPCNLRKSDKPITEVSDAGQILLSV